MARKPRDYKAEYARRKAKYPNDLAKARGHGSRQKEAVERKIRRMARNAKPEEKPDTQKVYQLGREKGWDVVEKALDLRERAEKAYFEGDVEEAHRIWAVRNPDLPDWLFKYHGYFA